MLSNYMVVLRLAWGGGADNEASLVVVRNCETQAEAETECAKISATMQDGRYQVLSREYVESEYPFVVAIDVGGADWFPSRLCSTQDKADFVCQRMNDLSPMKMYKVVALEGEA